MTATGNGPQRTCISCRQSKAQDQLVRFIVAPDGELMVDYRHRLPGRGAYTCLDNKCLKNAVERKQFQRSFRGRCHSVSFDPLLAGLTLALEQKSLNLLGMGRKSGQVVSGSNAVMTALRHETKLGLVIISKDISPAIAEKIKALSARHRVYCCQLFSKGLLGQILGKGERSVVAVQAGALADAIQIEVQRFTRLVREN